MNLVATVTSLEDFFSDLLVHALTEEDIQVEVPTREYLVQVIEDYAHRETLHGGSDPDERGCPALFSLYREAAEASPGARFEAFRRLGDTALVVSGFFGPHVERDRSAVSVDYYIDMGRAAYDSAARHAVSGSFQHMFFELAMKFSRLVEVFTRVAEETTLPVRKDLSTIYERLLRNPKSATLNRRLLQEGAGLVFSPTKVCA